MALNTYAKTGDGAFLMLGSTSLTALTTSVTTNDYTQIAQVLTFNPNLECSEHDVTHMQSGGVRQWIPGHLAATVQVTMNLCPDANTATNDVVDNRALLDVYQAKTTRYWALRVPQGQTNTSAPTVSDLVMAAFVTNYNWNVDRDAVNTADMTLRVADSIIGDV